MELDKFILNISNIEKSWVEDNQQLILELFEPIVYQMVVYTKMDTGRARKELGEKFAKKVGSQRILDAIEYDVEVEAKAYNHFNSETRAMLNQSTFRTLVSSKKISVSIISQDEGLFNQEHGVESSENHPRDKRDRHIIRHLTEVSDAINDVANLEIVNSPRFYSMMAKDIQEKVVEIIRKIEKDMFK